MNPHNQEWGGGLQADQRVGHSSTAALNSLHCSISSQVRGTHQQGTKSQIILLLLLRNIMKQTETQRENQKLAHPSHHLFVGAGATAERTRRSRYSRHHEGRARSRHPTQKSERHQRRRSRSREQGPRTAVIRRSFPPSPERSRRRGYPSGFLGGDGWLVRHRTRRRCKNFGTLGRGLAPGLTRMMLCDVEALEGQTDYRYAAE